VINQKDTDITNDVPLRILLVEDDPAMTALISAGLQYEGFIVTTARTGLEGLDAVAQSPPDLVILDWMLPVLDGLSLCRRLRQSSDAPIIMLTAKDAVEDRVAGLNAGADDYLVKPFHLDELLARIRARLRHKQPSANAPSFEDLTLDLDLREAIRGARRINLTATEFKLLHFFLRHPRQVLSKEMILEAVWGYDFSGEVNIVEQYVRSLRQKLGAPQLIQTMRLAGYVLREPE
jgi:two-component system response regulator MprA